MSREQVDHLVIGAGVVGMSIAWHLADAGGACLVVDAKGVGAGATSIQPGGVRTQWTSAVMCRMALESREFYRGIDDRLAPAQGPAFDPCGYVFVASTADSFVELQRRVRVQNDFGVASQVLTAEELAGMVEGLDPTDVSGAAYNADDGYFDRPGAVVSAFANAAERMGVEVQIDTAEQLEREAHGWRVVLASGATVSARHVVVAAAADTARLVGTAGYQLPITSEPRYLFYSDPIEPFLVRPLVVFQDRHLAVKHLADGSVLASDLSHGSTGEVDEAGWRREVTEKAKAALPILEHVRYPVMVEGHYDVTPDAQLIVGPVPGQPGLTVAAGMNGRGMMLAPSIGRMVADAVKSGTSPIPTELLPERFAEGRAQAGEGQVI